MFFIACTVPLGILALVLLVCLVPLLLVPLVLLTLAFVWLLRRYEKTEPEIIVRMPPQHSADAGAARGP